MSNLQPEQLKLFMGGQELKQSLTHSYDTIGQESMDNMWGRKVKESLGPTDGGHGSGVYRSMDLDGFRPERNSFKGNDGYKGGLTITHGQRDRDSKHITDGHHRVAAAADIEALNPGRNIWFNVHHSDPNYVDKNMKRPGAKQVVADAKARKAGNTPSFDARMDSLMKKLYP